MERVMIKGHMSAVLLDFLRKMGLVLTCNHVAKGYNQEINGEC